ncbi:MAG: serine hydrolase [Vicinamibacterales bacterium]
MTWLLMLAWLCAPALQDAVELQKRILALVDRAAAPAGQRTNDTREALDVSIVLLPLDGRSGMVIQPEKEFHAASTMKVPVMIELFRQAEAGLLRLDEPLAVKNEFHSIVDGGVYQLSVGDDSDAEVYKNIGKSMTLRALCEAMITVSSNFATNLLIERVGVENIRATMSRLGASGMNVLRGVEDQKAFDKGLNNSTTATALATLMLKIGTGQAVSRGADAEMVSILGRQKFNDAIPAGVPAGTRVAHKTGTITKIHHDAAIVYGPRPYVLVILARGIQDQKASAALMASISREIWNAMQR